MWKWGLAWGAAVLALSFVTGFFPGSSMRATAERCYLDHPYESNQTIRYKCVGHWTTAGQTHRGVIRGMTLDVQPWESFGKAPDNEWFPDGNWVEVAVPDSSRRFAMIRVPNPNTAEVYPPLVWLLRLALLLVLVSPIGFRVYRALRRQRQALQPRPMS
jgi:hypothetical protein